MKTDGPSPAWFALAACKGQTALYFPERHGYRADYEPAKALCAQCPVTGACLRYALLNRMEYGVWGQTTQEERKRLARGLGLWKKEPA